MAHANTEDKRAYNAAYKAKNPERVKAWSATYYTKHKEKILANQRERRERRLTWIRDYKTIKRCKYCHEDRFWVLDCHHRNPDEKEFSLTYNNVVKFGWNKILAEIKKCDVVCSNCHRDIHHQERQNDV